LAPSSSYPSSVWTGRGTRGPDSPWLEESLHRTPSSTPLSPAAIDCSSLPRLVGGSHPCETEGLTRAWVCPDLVPPRRPCARMPEGGEGNERGSARTNRYHRGRRCRDDPVCVLPRADRRGHIRLLVAGAAAALRRLPGVRAPGHSSCGHVAADEQWVGSHRDRVRDLRRATHLTRPDSKRATISYRRVS